MRGIRAGMSGLPNTPAQAINTIDVDDVNFHDANNIGFSNVDHIDSPNTSYVDACNANDSDFRNTGNIVFHDGKHVEFPDVNHMGDWNGKHCPHLTEKQQDLSETANVCMFLGARLVFKEGKDSVHITFEFRPFHAQTHAFKFKFFLHYKMGMLFSPPMVGTRPKNKNVHPAAPVMTEAAKTKAGIPSTRRRTKKPTKDEQIRELQARLASFEHPDETATVSKEPLFIRDSSPPEDVDPYAAESEAPTEVDSEDFVVVGGKRTPLSSFDPRSLKRTKTYSSFDKIQPTVRNKPSGLVNNWPRVLSKTGPATHRQVSPLTPSMPSPSTQVFPTTPTPFWQPQQSPVTPNVNSFDSFISSPDAAIPFLSQPPSPFHLNTQSHQSVNDVSQQFFQPIPTPNVVQSFVRKYKDKTGKTLVPGLKDLPDDIQLNFRNTFIRHIMKLVFSGTSPWTNPSLPVYQHQFNLVYSPLRYCLHGDDAVVIPTNCSLGVLRNQIGAEALTAVIEYLPSQYSKRMLDSKSKRAEYIATLLKSKQHPFIWEYFRPGTIEIPRGEEMYYDEKRRGPFQSIPVLRAFSMYFTSHGIQMHLPSDDAGRPVGALALAAAAVERGYSLHHTGDYVPTANDFSATNCLRATSAYIDQIKNDLTDDNWRAIFDALHRLQESRVHETQVEAGVVLEDREPLLPADPPTPPPA